MGQKPHDAFGISLCRVHHIEQHNIGVDAFGKKYGIDLWAMAAEFAERSPDAEMRSSKMRCESAISDTSNGTLATAEWPKGLDAAE
jgi:hypothetical protein